MPSVLVVDDQDEVRQLIRETLEQAGYEVEEARDGKEGLERYRARSTDLVIMDILMPEQDGLEAIMTLHREFPDTRVIAMTGEAIRSASSISWTSQRCLEPGGRFKSHSN